MLAAGFLIIFAGYSVGSWGVVLLKGYNITFREWVNPLHPFTWPADVTSLAIPLGQIMPGGASNAAPATGGGQLGTAVQSAVGAVDRAVSQAPPPGG